MIIIGITGSIASGKTTASKILSYKKGPLFSADKEVRKLYKNKNFKRLIINELKIKKKGSFKQILKNDISLNRNKIQKLEKIIHPIVRKKMKKFTSFHKNKNYIFYEIPLLIENKLMNYFDTIIFIKAKKKIRLERFKKKGGDKKFFTILNSKQLSDKKKIKYSDHVVVNENNLNILKKNLLSIIKLYV